METHQCTFATLLYDTEKLSPKKHLAKLGILKALDASFTHKSHGKELPTMARELHPLPWCLA